MMVRWRKAANPTLGNHSTEETLTGGVEQVVRGREAACRLPCNGHLVDILVIDIVIDITNIINNILITPLRAS